jgi:hypothetical protein
MFQDNEARQAIGDSFTTGESVVDPQRGCLSGAARLTSSPAANSQTVFRKEASFLL